jgi:hypothetical protein
MGLYTPAPVTSVAEFPGQSDRRHNNRTPALFSLLYSGINTGQMLIGDGTVSNLSRSGIGIRGNRSVTPGWNGAGTHEAGGGDASAILLVGSRHPFRSR